MPTADFDWLQTDSFRDNIRRVVEEEATASKVGVRDIQRIVDFLMGRAAQFRQDVEDRERTKPVRREVTEALDSVRQLIRATAQRVGQQGGGAISSNDVMEAYVAGFCSFWPFCPSPTPPDDKKWDIHLNVYKAYIENIGQLGSRHEALRTFYMTVISAIFTFLALAGGTDGLFKAVKGEIFVIVAWFGIAICVAWFMHMGSFAGLFSAKLATLRKIETNLTVEPFTLETVKPQEKWRLRLTTVDRWVAVIFIGLFIWLLNVKLD
jgi:hypothetical protein